MSDVPSRSTHPIHLGLGATAVVEPAFTGGMEWYAGYSQRHDEADGAGSAGDDPHVHHSRT